MSIVEVIESHQNDIIQFARDLVQTRSVTGSEEKIAFLVKKKMESLNYDGVHIDTMGNVLGILGNGPGAGIILDSHLDTVPVDDEVEWHYPPFAGMIEKGYLYGRGAADMKCGLAAAIYAGYALKSLGLTKNKRVYISATVMEEDYDGVALRHLIDECDLDLFAAVMCEPSNLNIGIGHRGRALLKIEAKGMAAHASHPHLGCNAIYIASEIANRIMHLDKSIEGSVAVTSFHSRETSNNSIPASAVMLLDRRLAMSEDENFIRNEMDTLLKDHDANWEIIESYGETWKGKEIVLRSFLPAWEIESNHPLVCIAHQALTKITDKEPHVVSFDFSTNATATAAQLKIPTLILGPGRTEHAHAVNEKCSIQQMIDACKVYAHLCHSCFESTWIGEQF